MKLTTKRPSPKLLGGLAFKPATKLEHQVFIGIQAWHLAKRPANAFIYDHPGALQDAGIPILDAAFVKGAWVKLPVILPLQLCTPKLSNLHDAEAEAFSTEDGTTYEHSVMVVSEEATTKASGHSKMSRGVGKRMKKPKA